MRTAKAESFPPPFTEEVVRSAGGGIVAAAMLLAALTMPAAAGWRDEASPYDVQRLEKIDEARDKALAEAQAGGSVTELAVIDSVLHAQAVPASAKALTGNWRCRTIKLGGITPEVVYSWFRCRVSVRGDGLFFEKLTGSQRTSGALYAEGEGYVYLGASYVAAGYGPPEKPPVYSGKGTAAGAPATPDDEIGLLSLLSDGRARLELPYPVQESVFDVIELKR